MAEPALLANDVELPYSADVNLNAATDSYTLTVSGQVSAEPVQFAVNILSGEDILFHMNPRWPEGRIVFNDCTGEGWGEEEEAPLPESLQPETSFTVTVVVSNEEFKVRINEEEVAVFKQRQSVETTERKVGIDKVDQSDVSVSLVKLEIQ